MPTTLTDYITDTASFLHDNNLLFNSRTQLIRWINEARKHTAKRTGCIQRLVTGQSAFGASAQPGFFIPGGAQPGALPGAFPGGTVQGAAAGPFQVLTGIERYPFSGFFNPYLQQSHAGCERVVDVASLSVSWGGSIRPTLDWMPWDNLQAYARAYSTLVTSYAYYWSVLNPGAMGEVWIFPVPSFTGDMEALIYATPINLNSDNDVEALPEEVRDTIKFKAASYAYLSSQRWSQALLMDNMFADHLGIDRVSADMGKTPSYYWSILS
jgi:hypothetical protein